MSITKALVALTEDDPESAFSKAQSLLRGGCSYDDEILAVSIMGLAVARPDNLDEGRNHFGRAIAKDAERESGEFVFSADHHRGLIFERYQTMLVLKGRQIAESSDPNAAVRFLSNALASLAYLGDDYWSLIHLELGGLYHDMNKADLAATHWRAAVDASPIFILSDFERDTKEKARRNLKLENGSPESRSMTRRTKFAGSYRILASLIVLGILGIAGGGYWVVAGLCLFLLAFVYWKRKSG
jgi:hypothetical protein